jgi:lipopolysaccharide export system permease protein
VLINRHFSRELINCLLAVTLIVLVIFLGNQLIRYLNDAAAGNMALAVVGRLVLLEIPYLLALLLPITLFISVLLILGRMSVDHELIALKACGFSPWQQWQMIAKPCYCVAALVAVLALLAQPKIATYRNQLLATTNAGASIDTLIPEKFQTGLGGRYVFYVEKSSVDHKHLFNIFVAENKQPGANGSEWNVIKAENGALVEDLSNQAQFIQISNGNRYIGNAGEAKFQVMQFQRYLMLSRNPQTTALNNQTDAYSTWQLLSLMKFTKASGGTKNLARLAAAELEWRVALPLSCLLLSILACLLGEIPPRYGRYARLFPGILFLIIYINLLFVTRNLVAQGSLNRVPGLFWLQLLMILFIVTYTLPRRWRRGSRWIAL